MEAAIIVGVLLNLLVAVAVFQIARNTALTAVSLRNIEKHLQKSEISI